MEDTPNTASDNNKKIIATITTLVVVVLIVFGISAFTKKKTVDTLATASGSGNTLADSTSEDSSATTAVAANSTAPTPTPAPAAAATIYRDGTYTATGSYGSPGGEESVKVTVTIAGDKVTNSTVVSEANDGEAQEYQDMFISGYKSSVVGKALSSIKLSRVSGSSLTSQGFNNALATIKSQAKV